MNSKGFFLFLFLIFLLKNILFVSPIGLGIQAVITSFHNIRAWLYSWLFYIRFISISVWSWDVAAPDFSIPETGSCCRLEEVAAYFFWFLKRLWSVLIHIRVELSFGYCRKFFLSKPSTNNQDWVIYTFILYGKKKSTLYILKLS